MILCQNGSVLRCVAVGCSVLQCVAAQLTVQNDSVSKLQFVAVCCILLQCFAVYSSVL